MIDCVIAADGYSYERTAIRKWLLDSDQSPVTGKALPHNSLLPNINLKSIISMHNEHQLQA